MKPEEINVAIFDKIAESQGLTREQLIQKVNVAIAEACGWINIERDSFNGWWGSKPMSPGDTKHFIADQRLPNYYGDLNAIHEAEKLKLFPNADGQVDVKFEINYRKNLTNIQPWRLWNATAPQRCEAFLKTLGKWVETKGEGE